MKPKWVIIAHMYFQIWSSFFLWNSQCFEGWKSAENYTWHRLCFRWKSLDFLCSQILSAIDRQMETMLVSLNTVASVCVDFVPSTTSYNFQLLERVLFSQSTTHNRRWCRVMLMMNSLVCRPQHKEQNFFTILYEYTQMEVCDLSGNNCC